MIDGGGTRGVVTGVPEAVVNLAVSLQLATLLRRSGVRVVLTRRRTAGVSSGNAMRARVANRRRAALFLRVHADGSGSRAAQGTTTLYPAWRRSWTDDVYGQSARAARVVQRELVRTLRSRNRGVSERSDITGFNWADVPAVLVEVGFMTNRVEDRRLASRAYQRRAAVGLCHGVVRYLGRSSARCGRRSTGA